MKKKHKKEYLPPLDEVRLLMKDTLLGSKLAEDTLKKRLKKSGWRKAFILCLSEINKTFKEPKENYKASISELSHLLELSDISVYSNFTKCKHCDSFAIPGDDVCHMHAK